MKLINTKYMMIENSKGEISHHKADEINWWLVTAIIALIAFSGFVFASWGWV